jgi:hypothetical protein
MRNRPTYGFLVLMFYALAVSLSSCTKEPGSDNSISAQDHGNIIAGTEVTIDDATSTAEQVRGISGKVEGGPFSLCSAAFIDTGNGNQVTINYDSGTICRGLLRNGQVVVSIVSGPHWRDAYAVLQVVFNDLSITNTVTGASYVINGTYTVTNETGGLAWRILSGLDQNVTVSHRLQADSLSITFPNGAHRIWSVDRTRKFSSAVSSGQNRVTISVSSENTKNIESWGTDRNGDSFTSTLVNDIASNNNLQCPWKPYQGEYSQIVGGKTVDILYGVDSNGNPLNNPNGCAYGYKITYSNGRKILTKVIPYIY